MYVQSIFVAVTVRAYVFIYRRFYFRFLTDNNVQFPIEIFCCVSHYQRKNVLFVISRYSPLPHLQGIVDAALSLAVAADVILAALLSFYLNSSRSGIERYNPFILSLFGYM